MRWRWLAFVAMAAFVGTASAQSKPARGGVPLEYPALERFDSEAEFLRYVRAVQGEGRRRGYGADEAIVVTGSMAPPPAPPPPPTAQAAPSVVSSAPMADGVPEGSSITNVQTQGVDEGGIVKQVGRFLVVLQDGRLFVTDMRPNGQPGLELVTRANVYRNTQDSTWFDEMLVSGNRILVTGYSYAQSASEVTIFTIDDAGQLTREATYYLSSNDYYDTENYATRLVNGNLVIYTPLAIHQIDASRPVRWPLIRRWIRDEGRRAITTNGRPIFDAASIYKPLRASQQPVVHSVSVCPLGGPNSGDELACETTAVVGASEREFLVSTTDIFLWLTPHSYELNRPCPAPAAASADANAVPATVYQVPLRRGAAPRAMFARGVPADQLGLASADGEFRALLRWDTLACNRGDTSDLRYFHAPLTAFATRPAQAQARRYIRVPDPGARDYETRFVGAHLVYGAAGQTGAYPPPPSESPVTARVVTVPLARPNAPTIVTAPHGILRVERAGADVVLTGYRDEAGLSVSVLDLAQRPRIVETRVLAGRYESEGRTHAFNALVGPDGAGLMGVATVGGRKEGGRWHWRSQASDLSFLAVDATGRLRPLGELTATPNATHPSYRCEVSCIDWYGNSRALFTDGRVFALSGTELIEGGIDASGIAERRRLNLSAPLARRR